MSNNKPTSIDLLALTAQVVSAHVGNNAVAPADVPALISAVHEALAESSAPEIPEAPKPTPAVPIRRSIQPDYVVCLEDGKKMKMLQYKNVGAFSEEHALMFQTSDSDVVPQSWLGLMFVRTRSFSR